MFGIAGRWPLLDGGDPRSPRISHSLGLAQTVSEAGSIFNRDFSDFLDLLDVFRRPERAVVIGQRGPYSYCVTTVDQRGYRNITCTNLQGNVPPTKWIVSVSQAMSLLETIFGGKTKEASVVTTLTLVQALVGARQVDISQSIVLTQTIVSDLFKAISQVLTLSQALGVQITANRTIADALALLESIQGNYEVTLSVSDQLLLLEAISLIRQFAFSDALVLIQTIQRIQPGAVAHALALIETSLAKASTGQADAMAISQGVGAQIQANRSFSDALGMRHGAVAWVIRSSGNSEQCDVAGLAAENILLVKDVVFTWPYSGPSLTLTLRAPRFGNSTSLDVGTIVRKNRGGEYKVSRPSTWPTVEILKMSFESLTDAKKDSAFDFFATSAGKEVGFRDQENIQWRGVILTPVTEIEQAFRTCAFEFSVEFRGKRV